MLLLLFFIKYLSYVNHTPSWSRLNHKCSQFYMKCCLLVDCLTSNKSVLTGTPPRPREQPRTGNAHSIHARISVECFFILGFLRLSSIRTYVVMIYFSVCNKFCVISINMWCGLKSSWCKQKSWRKKFVTRRNQFDKIILKFPYVLCVCIL